MLFEKEYDTSLWYIMKVDKEKRKELIKFVNELPEEFINNIRESLKQAKNTKLEYNEEISGTINSKDDPNTFFTYQIDFVEALTISKGYYNEGYEDIVFSLMLFPVGPKFIKEYMYNYEGAWLGTLSSVNEIKHVSKTVSYTNEDEREYELFKTPIGLFVTYNKELKNEKERTIIKPMFNKIPTDLEMSNKLDDDKIVKRLLR